MEARKRTAPAPYADERRSKSKKRKKKRASRRGYLNFCRAHNFGPVKMTLILIVLAALVIFGGFSTIRTVITSDTTRLGLANIGELATQVAYYTNVQVISSSREVFGIDVPFTQNKYVFSYDGVIKAGIDFAEVDVNVNELTRSITVTLPEIRVLSNEIDEESLEVYDETKNIFNPLKLENVNLSLITLKEQSEATSIENGLLENARENAEVLIRGFLEGSFDLQQYSVHFE